MREFNFDGTVRTWADLNEQDIYVLLKMECAPCGTGVVGREDAAVTQEFRQYVEADRPDVWKRYLENGGEVRIT